MVAPKGEATRPTADRTRETLFSMLTSRLGSFDDLQVADLFAGSGALGLEALSRGAANCLFVEHDRSALAAIKANIATLDAREHTRIEATSVMHLRARSEPLDLLLVDPPYHTGAGAVALDRLLRLGWIGEATWMALETAAEEEPRVVGLRIEVSRKVGKGKVSLLRLG